MNYYDLLELSSEATKEEIKKQYHSLSKKYHPDKNNGEDTQFKKIKEAFDVLYDDEERKKYDIQLLFGDIQFTEEDIVLLFLSYVLPPSPGEIPALYKGLLPPLPSSSAPPSTR